MNSERGDEGANSFPNVRNMIMHGLFIKYFGQSKSAIWTKLWSGHDLLELISTGDLFTISLVLVNGVVSDIFSFLFS